MVSGQNGSPTTSRRQVVHGQTAKVSVDVGLTLGPIISYDPALVETGSKKTVCSASGAGWLKNIIS